MWWIVALVVTYEGLRNKKTQGVYHLVIRDIPIARMNKVDTVERQPRTLRIKRIHDPL